MATKANRRAVTRRDTMPARAVLVTDPKGKASQMANNVQLRTEWALCERLLATAGAYNSPELCWTLI